MIKYLTRNNNLLYSSVSRCICMSLALFSSTQSASFQCEYKTDAWGTLGTIYYCSIQNAVNITSLDATQVDSISGSHQAGYNNDNVEAIQVTQGQIHYFPRGLNKLFKNLKGISFHKTGLKEVHQSDLKDFPKMMNLYLYSSDLEVIEENLFEFNPNLEYIYLIRNKITHIDPTVFNNLTKLKTLFLNSNTCINKAASNNPTEVQNIIKTAKAQCISSDYSNLKQKVKTLEIESKSLNSENFKEKLEKLAIEIKNSKFPNTFYHTLQELKATQTKKAQETITTEFPKEPEVSLSEIFSAIKSKVDNIALNVMDLLIQTGNRSNSEQCAAKNEKIDENFSNLDKKLTKLSENFTNSYEKMSELSGTVTKVDENVANLKEVIMNFHKETSTSVKDEPADSSKMKIKISKISEKMEKFDIKLEILEENLSNFKTFSYKKFDKMENEEKVFHAIIKKVTEKTTEEVEMKIGEIEAKIDRKFDEIDGKFEEMERKFEEKLVEILKIVKNGE